MFHQLISSNNNSLCLLLLFFSIFNRNFFCFSNSNTRTLLTNACIARIVHVYIMTSNGSNERELGGILLPGNKKPVT